MNIQEKIQEAIQSPLIAMISFSDEEIEEIKVIVRRDIERAETRPNRRILNLDDLLVLLVLLTKQWGDATERRFWQVMWEEILDDPNYKPSNFFYDDLEKTIEHAGKHVFLSKGDKRRFCEFIQYHALAPQASFNAFMSLMWNAFLDEDLFSANYKQGDPLVEKIVTWLGRKFSGVEDALVNEGFEFDGKTYNIRAALKYAFMQNPKDEMIRFTQEVLKCIDRNYYCEAPSVSLQNCFLDLCEQSVGELLLLHVGAGERQRLILEKETLVDISRAYAAYEIDNENVPIVFIPDIRMIDYEGNQVQVSVFSNDMLISTHKRYLVGEGLKRRIKRIEFPLFELLPQIPQSIRLRVELWGDEHLLFSSQDKLFRSYLLFGERREARGNTLRPGVYGLVCSDSVLYEQQFDVDISISPYGCHKNITTQSGSVFIYNNRAVLFADRNAMNSVCRLEGTLVQYLYACKEDALSPIYRDMPRCILHISPQYPSASIGIYLDGKYLGSLDSISDENTLATGLWEISLHGIVGNVFGMHELWVTDLRTGSGTPICGVSFGVSKQYHIKLEKPFCFGDSTSVLLYDGFEKKITPINTDTGCGYIESEIGRLCINPPCLRWRLDDAEWHMNCVDIIYWHKASSFHNNVVLEIDAPAEMDVRIFLGETQLAASSQKQNRFLLGDAMQTNALPLAPVSLEVGNQRFTPFTIAFQPRLLAMPKISLDEGVIRFDAQNEFIGDSEAKLELSFFDEDEQLIFKHDSALKSIFLAPLMDGYYMLQINLVVETLSDSKRCILGTFEDIPCGNPDRFRFKGFRLILKKTQYKKGNIHFDNTKIDRIRYLREDLHPVYQGTLFSPGVKQQVIQFSDKGRTLRVYYLNNDEMEPANVDIQTKRLVHSSVDNQRVFACSSVYYDYEEAEHDV